MVLVIPVVAVGKMTIVRTERRSRNDPRYRISFIFMLRVHTSNYCARVDEG